MRLDKFLSEQNISTRSLLKKDIKKGLVAVNGEIAKKPEQHIDPEKDVVTYNGKTVGYEPFRYLMLNKPAGVVSATEDNRDKTVIELIASELRKDLFPVGRLDKDTEGLLLLTNDGVLAHQLLSPKKHVDKTYFVKLAKDLTLDAAKHLEEGVDIGEKNLTLPAKIHFENCKEKEVHITIQEGKFHQVKRMFQAVDNEVLYLKRISMGTLVLDDRLQLGEYRPLTKEELDDLKGLTIHADK